MENGVSVGRLFVVACVLAAFWPEVIRYRGERQLANYEGISQTLAGRPDPGAHRMLIESANGASRLSTYPGDWRPLTVAGTMLVRSGNHHSSIAMFEQALMLGERPEIDVNLASALRAAGQRERADDLLVRAIWLSPAVAGHVNPPDRMTALRRVVQMDERLRKGTLEENDFP